MFLTVQHTPLVVRPDDLTGPEIVELLRLHLESMAAISPPESRHALDLQDLRKPDVSFWTAWDGRELAGCGALKEIHRTHGEIKSMRTASKYLRKGVAATLLSYIIGRAQARGYRRLSLETGAEAYFAPARALYTKFGFQPCAPFAGYAEDQNSVFMTMDLRQKAR